VGLGAVAATLLPECDIPFFTAGWSSDKYLLRDQQLVAHSLKDSQGICTSNSCRFCCEPKQADRAIIKNCIAFLSCAEIIFIFLDCEMLVVI